MEHIPYGPAAGLSESQAITVASSQDSQDSHTSHSSSQTSTASDTTTGASHREDDDMAEASDHESFIDDVTEPSQALETPSLSQDIAGLSPPGSVSAARLVRQPTGSYRERSTSADGEELESAYTPDGLANDRDHTPTPTTPLHHGLHTSAHAPSHTLRTEDNITSPSAMADRLASSNINPMSRHYLAAESMERVKRHGHPSPTWTAVQTASERIAHPPTGTIEGVLPAYINTNITHVQFAVQGAAMEALEEHLKHINGPRQYHVELLSGRFRCIRISFATAELLLAAHNLRIEVDAIDDNPPFVIENFKIGAALGARYIPWQVRHNGLSPFAAKKRLDEAVKLAEGVFIVEVWTVNHHLGPPPAPKNCHNVLVALLFVRPPRGGNYSTPLTADELRVVPAFIGKPNGHILVAIFPGRPPWCKGCKALAQRRDDFHTSSSCHNGSIPCAICNQWGHVGAACPKDRRNANNNSNPASSSSGSGLSPNENDQGFTIVDPAAGNSSGYEHYEYAPAGPTPAGPDPAPLPSSSANVVPVPTPSSSDASASHQNNNHSSGSGDTPNNPQVNTRGRGRGHGRGGLPTRTQYQQAYITMDGGVSRQPQAGPSTPQRTHNTSSSPRKRGRATSDDETNPRRS